MTISMKRGLPAEVGDRVEALQFNYELMEDRFPHKNVDIGVIQCVS